MRDRQINDAAKVAPASLMHQKGDAAERGAEHLDDILPALSAVRAGEDEVSFG